MAAPARGPTRMACQPPPIRAASKARRSRSPKARRRSSSGRRSCGRIPAAPAAPRAATGKLSRSAAASAGRGIFSRRSTVSIIRRAGAMAGAMARPATSGSSPARRCAAHTRTALARNASAATKLDLATVWPDGNFHTTNAKKFAEEVGKATGGEVKITVQAGGSLGFKGPEQLRAVRDGLVPLADVLNIQQVGDEPMLGTESIPFLVGSDKELKILHKYLRPEYEAIAAKNNQKVLYMVPWPTQYLHLKVKTDTLDGLKGVKIRVPDKNAQDMCAAVGMAPVLIPWGETIPALASGAVSGVSTSSVSGGDGKFWEFLK